jgi:NAD(P) transhydrogenase
MTHQEFDLVVIGSGPGGEGAAMQAAKGGKRVAVVESYDRIGGGCTHWGTIPSKALRFSIFSAVEAMDNPIIRDLGVQMNPTFSQLRASSRSIIDKQVSMRQSFYDRNQVPVYHGRARFLDQETIEIDSETQLKYSHAVIATGSRPYHPPDVDFSHPRIFDSDTILSLDFHPQSLTIYGAGVIGCEYASMFRCLRIKVNLVNTRSQLLDFLDDEIVDALSFKMRDSGIILRHNEVCSKVEGRGDGVILSLDSGKQIKTDALLWANGRSGNTEDLNLSTIGVQVNRRGQIDVDECFRTACPHVYAVGDVIGYPSLASAAYMQGRAAAAHIQDPKHAMKLGDIPTGIYTIPEISSVGRNEKELTEAKVPYEVGQSQFKSLAYAQITGRAVGMLKLLFHPETLEILGVHCFGPNASEIIHIGQAIMKQPPPHNSLDYFINTTFNYPTMAEAYRVAALNGKNRLF